MMLSSCIWGILLNAVRLKKYCALRNIRIQRGFYVPYRYSVRGIIKNWYRYAVPLPIRITVRKAVNVKQKSARVGIVFSNENDGYQPEKHHTDVQNIEQETIQPLPVAQLHWCQPGVEHHEKDAGQGEGDRKQRGFEPTEAMVGRVDTIGHIYLLL